MLCLLGSSLVVSLVVLLIDPQMAVYRGLSGVDSGLFVLAVLLTAKEQERNDRVSAARLTRLALVGFMAKTLFEIGTGGSVYVVAAASGMVPLPCSHIAGALAGWVAARPRRD